jgi:hypothetical protein
VGEARRKVGGHTGFDPVLLVLGILPEVPRSISAWRVLDAHPDALAILIAHRSGIGGPMLEVSAVPALATP